MRKRALWLSLSMVVVLGATSLVEAKTTPKTAPAKVSQSKKQPTAKKAAPAKKPIPAKQVAKKAPAKKSPAKKAKQEIPSLTADGKPNVLSHSIMVLDLDSGAELFSKNADEQRPIASISKLAAALAVREAKIDLTAVTEITPRDAEIAERGSKPHLKVGWEIPNKDLLYAALIASENRAVPAMGRGAGLSEQQLIKEMNQVAKQLKLKKTTFDEPTGLSYNNQSSARDVAKLLRAAIEDPVLADAMQSATYDVQVVEPKDTVVSLWNTNRLIHSENYTVLGAKTGYNAEAGYCLVVALEVNKRKVVIAVLGADQKLTRYGDVSRIVTWLEAQ